MPVAQHLRLGVNIDHVATIRNARGGRHPDPVRAAKLAIHAGADGITAHLREDRRHISDDDIARLKAEIDKPLNLEMAATPEMTDIAVRTRPHAACLVPERRAERTTEGGLDAAGQRAELGPRIAALPEIMELNIGYYMIGEALFVGLGETVRAMRAAMVRGRGLLTASA